MHGASLRPVSTEGRMPFVLLVLIVIIGLAMCSGPEEDDPLTKARKAEYRFEHHQTMRQKCRSDLDLMLSPQCECLLNSRDWSTCLDRNPDTRKPYWEEYWAERQNALASKNKRTNHD